MPDYIVTVTGEEGGFPIDANLLVNVEDAAGVAPILTLPVDNKTGATTASIGVTTDRANGTLYAVVSTSATPPSAAQVKLGQMHTGAAAADAPTPQVITTTGAKTFSATGLTASTAYFAHFMHEDEDTNQSTVSSGNGFTTDAPGTVTYAPAGATPNGTTNFASNTVVNRGYRIDNDAVVYTVGIYLAVSRSLTIKIVKRDSAGQYDVVHSESFAHLGGGWDDKTLSSPFTVPATGDYFPAAYIGASATVDRTTADRAMKSGNIVGNNQTGFVEVNGSTFCLRVTGTIPA